jgi:hypothetical protein
MRLNSRKERNRLSGPYTVYRRKNLRFYMITSRRTLRKDLFENHSPLQDFLYCLSLRKMANYDYAWITVS